MNAAWENRDPEEKLVRRLVDNAPDVMVVLETDFTVRYVTPSAEQVLG